MKNLIKFPTTLNKNIIFTDILKKSEELVNNMDPIKNINKFISKNRSILKDKNELLGFRLYQLSKYKLSLFLNREIQQEIYLRGNFVSNKLNNEIISEKFSFYEDKTNNMILHKRVDDYFIMIHFRYMKPNVDKKYITQLNNMGLQNYYEKFGDDMGIFRQLSGASDNPDFLESQKENLHSQGVQHVEDYYPDYTPFNFNINILNSNSEMLQYICYAEENQNNMDDFDKARLRDKEQIRNFLKKKEFNTEILAESDADDYSPDFYTLNKKVQQEFIDLISKLEITPEVANYAKYLGLNRERREFIAWMYKFLNLLKEE